MEVFYIYHSCFVIKLCSMNLVFDYYEGEDGNGKQRIEQVFAQLDCELPFYVFVSHKHRDHFSHEIFKWITRFHNIQFFLSKDCKMSQNYRRKIGMSIEAEKCILYMGKNQTYESKNIRVQTLTSTDEGVAFCIECEGKSIYHAGDLNWWTWKGETKEEFLEMKKRFQGEIQKIKGEYFDLAFLPLDPRQEEKFYWGFDYFMRNTNTKLAYPMHFWDELEVIERIKNLDCAKEYRDKIAKTEWYQE